MVGPLRSLHRARAHRLLAPRMRKFTIAFLRNPSHAFLKRGPPPSLSFNTLASTPDAAEGGACKPDGLPEISMGSLETHMRKIGCESLHADKKARPTSACNALPGALEINTANLRKAREPKADKIGCGSLHAEISPSLAEKARPTIAKAKRKAKASELSEIGVLKEKIAAQNGAEEAALHAKFNATSNESIINAKKELSELAAKVDLNNFKSGPRWEETANKLLDHGISSAHVKEMLPKCRKLPRGTNSLDSTLMHFT